MKRWLPLVPALVAMLVFLNTLGNGLTYDDKGTLELATKIVKGGSEEFGRALTYASHLPTRPGAAGCQAAHHEPRAKGTRDGARDAIARRLARSDLVAFVCGLVLASTVHVEAVASTPSPGRCQISSC
jgi:hypothetical protein